MANNAGMSREERLAAKLRENLRRRKVQARALDGTQAGAAGGESGETLHKEPPSR